MNSRRPTPSRFALLMRTLPQLFAALLVAASVLCSCDEEKKEVIAGKTDPETTPTMTTTDVATLISDSGITRYKITTPVWYVFDEARDPRWTFPKSLHLEKFDDSNPKPPSTATPPPFSKTNSFGGSTATSTSATPSARNSSPTSFSGISASKKSTPTPSSTSKKRVASSKATALNQTNR